MRHQLSELISLLLFVGHCSQFRTRFVNFSLQSRMFSEFVHHADVTLFRSEIDKILAISFDNAIHVLIPKGGEHFGKYFRKNGHQLLTNVQNQNCEKLLHVLRAKFLSWLLSELLNDYFNDHSN